jgi:hypothetical protein
MESFPKIPRAQHEALWFARSQLRQTKQNNGPAINLISKIVLYDKLGEILFNLF